MQPLFRLVSSGSVMVMKRATVMMIVIISHAVTETITKSFLYVPYLFIFVIQ